ncbi:hypothetical protein [Halomonas sp. Mc5H-6]|uniref:SDH family Clp fold serine proteinase n=1 Tax=Halomonas sp. Mc5H-6 TaxID=2954500 RepID=UPI002097B561|nr:hypothetical protein [Halomonas sp. Mc5H-6]MCO7246403.1 hypothetical protein [Halomonas sp. Mc5H-6]
MDSSLNSSMSFFSMNDHQHDESTESEDSSTSHNSKFSASRNFLISNPADFYIFSGEIKTGQEREFARIIKKGQASDKAILWLTTPGGSPDGAYMIARTFQRHYKHFSIFINSFCKSSGTLICLGADELLMDQNGHLGPLDIQILNREEFGERHSGLNPMEALNSIGTQATDFLKEQFLNVRFGGGLSTRQALEVSTNLAGHLFSPITAQLDFMKYGEFTRSMRIGIEYGLRLANHRDQQNLHPQAVQRLAMHYPSHGFVIDREEAANELFSGVVNAPDLLLGLADELQAAIDKALYNPENAALILDLRDALGVRLPLEPDEPSGSQPVEAVPESESDSNIPEEPMENHGDDHAPQDTDDEQTK